MSYSDAYFSTAELAVPHWKEDFDLYWLDHPCDDPRSAAWIKKAYFQGRYDELSLLSKGSSRIMESVSKYRIVTNGLTFRIEKLCTVGWLWWKRQTYKPIPDWNGLFDYLEFSSLDEAKKAKKAKEARERILHDWEPVWIEEGQIKKGHSNPIPTMHRPSPPDPQP